MVQKLIKPTELMDLSSFEELIGHKYGDAWIDELESGEKRQIMLGSLNNTLCYIYLTPKIEHTDFAEYVNGSVKLNILNTLSPVISNNPNAEVVSAVIDKCMKTKEEGILQLRKFIENMRTKYELDDDADFGGDKFFSPIDNVMMESDFEKYQKMRERKNDSVCECENKKNSRKTKAQKSNE